MKITLEEFTKDFTPEERALVAARSGALASIYETAEGLHAAGVWTGKPCGSSTRHA